MRSFENSPCLLRLALSAVLLVVVATFPAAADDVHLTNGNSFEGVVAEVEGAEVRIRLPHGELSLPLSKVARIERESSPLESYLERKRRLLERETAGAEDWLELARWAEAQGLRHAAKESAVAAARQKPQLERLEGLMERLGYVYEPDLGRWLSRDEYLRSKGWVFSGGRWLSPEQQKALRIERIEHLALLEAERERRREHIAHVALETAVEARVQAEVAREVARQPAISHFGTPLFFGTTFVPFFAPHHPHHGGGDLPPPEVQRRQIDPPAREVILNRDFGGRLGGSAPGRINARSSSRP